MEMSIQIDRLSHSFPPGYAENNKYLAKVHTLFPMMDEPFCEENVYYRAINNENELDEVKLLHKEWFPPQYPDDFYRALLRNNVYKSLLCLYDASIKGQKHTLILGCITYEYREVDYDILKFSLTDLFSEKRCVYILTFGVINEVRKKGIGSKLLKRVITETSKDYSVKYIYLDVVEYNDQGIRCYENNGFVRAYTKNNHYNIFDKEYNAHVYCYFTNDGEMAKSLVEMLKACLYYMNVPYHLYNACRAGINQLKQGYNRTLRYKELKV